MRAARRLAIVLAGIGLLAGPIVPSQAALTPTKVIATDAFEYDPAASADYVAWVVWTGKHNVAYAQALAGGSPFRVNALHTDGWVGGIDGTTLIYQQYSHRTGTSDVYVFDLVAKTRTPIGGPVNSSQWEYDPSMSGDWVMWARWFPNGNRRLLMYNSSTLETRVVATSTGDRHGLTPGQVNGLYATIERYTVGARRTTSCDVFLYDITGETTVPVPNAGPKCQFGSSVNPAGTVYYGRAGFGCGVHSSLRELPLGGSPTTLVELPDGRDFYTSYAVDNGDTTTDVFYDPVRCTRTGDANIVKITAP